MARQPLQQQLLLIAGATASIIAPLMLAYVLLVRADLSAYARHGVVTEATVRSKTFVYRRYASGHEVDVGFWTGSILEDGQLVFATVSEFVRVDTWKSLEAGDKVEVIYLPDDPQHRVIFRDSLDPASYPPIERVEFGAGMLIFGITCLLLRKWFFWRLVE